MNGYTYFQFFGILIVIILFEYDFCVKDHLICDVPDDIRQYTEMFCMSKTENLISSNEGAYLKSYGRWQFFIVIQMFIAAFACRVDLKIRDLELYHINTIGKRYVLTCCLLVALIVCWMVTYFSMGGYFNIFILKVFSHMINTHGTPCPITSVFPTRAQCLVESMSTNETYSTMCDLPLNSKAPYYFLALWFVYSITLLFILHAVFRLAREKVAETYGTRRARETCLRNPKELEANEPHVIHRDSPRITLEPLIKDLLKSMKNWTRPNFSLAKSSSQIPLVSDV